MGDAVVIAACALFRAHARPTLLARQSVDVVSLAVKAATAWESSMWARTSATTWATTASEPFRDLPPRLSQSLHILLHVERSISAPRFRQNEHQHFAISDRRTSNLINRGKEITGDGHTNSKRNQKSALRLLGSTTCCACDTSGTGIRTPHAYHHTPHLALPHKKAQPN